MRHYPIWKPEILNRDTSPSAAYARGVAAGRWHSDPAQQRVLASLDGIYHRVQGTPTPGWIGRWRTLLQAPPPARGLYLWGAVGRGKTLLMDLLHDALPAQRALRMHFHRFMGRVHQALRDHAGEADPLRAIAHELLGEAKLICLDEFLVQDIGDAMILSELLKHLIEAGGSLVTTSNLPPHRLYEGGLQRARFLPAIALLQAHCELIELLGPTDYRLRSLTAAHTWHSPADANAESALAATFDRLAPGSLHAGAVMVVHQRAIPVHKRADGIVWFQFAAICVGPRAVADYIEIARSFNTVCISQVPLFDNDAGAEDAAKRFVHLVDEFYDRNVKLIVSAAAAPTGLYHGRRHSGDFARTASRLIEMQSTEYLARPHRSG